MDDLFDFESGKGDVIGDVIGGSRKLHILVQPVQGNFHDAEIRELAELLEEANIVLIEETDVVDAVTLFGDAFDAHAKGESGVFFRIDASGSKHIRVNHACAEDFHPTALRTRGIPPDVHFKTGFGEGEEGGTHPVFDLAVEHHFGEHHQGFLQFSEGDVFVDVQGFDLMEQEIGFIVDGFIAVHASGHDGADGRFAREHVSDLRRRGVRAQQQIVLRIVVIFANEERVLHIARGVLRREIERGEIVEVVFELGSVGHGETEAEEHLLDLFKCECDRVQRSEWLRSGGKREIVGGTQCGGFHTAQTGFRVVKTLLSQVTKLIEELAGLGALIGGESAHSGKQIRDRRFPDQESEAVGFQVFGCGQGRGLNRGAKVIYFGVHMVLKIKKTGEFKPKGFRSPVSTDGKDGLLPEGGVDDSLECFRVEDCQVGQCLSVDFHVLLFHGSHQLRVRDSVEA